nr:protein ACCELERATED CELL DEATH 6-like [Ipomoea batatas]
MQGGIPQRSGRRSGPRADLLQIQKRQKDTDEDIDNKINTYLRISFLYFVASDTIAFTNSVLAIFSYMIMVALTLWCSIRRDRIVMSLCFLNIITTFVALIAVVAVFLSGLYAILGFLAPFYSLIIGITLSVSVGHNTKYSQRHSWKCWDRGVYNNVRVPVPNSRYCARHAAGMWIEVANNVQTCSLNIPNSFDDALGRDGKNCVLVSAQKCPKALQVRIIL